MMNPEDLTDEDVELLNSKVGLKYLFAEKKVNLEKVLYQANYEAELRAMQAKLIKLQEWVIQERQRVIIIFEGRDAAGKGGAIRRITAHINPRHYRIVALPRPTADETDQWYLKRYVDKLPKPGEIVFFDRSWYNRAVVEPVNGFCTDKEYKTFMGQVNDFERMITESGAHLVKIYFSISKDEQAKRFEEIKASPLKKWKMTKVDEEAQRLWDNYTSYKEEMFNHTNNDYAEWKIIHADKKTLARIEAATYILDSIPYE